MINILVVDDQNLVLEGICGLLALNPEFKVVAQLTDSTQTVATLKQHKPDILLLDIRMPQLDGLGVLAQMQAQKIQLPTLMLTTFDEHELVLQSLQLGALGYLRKDVSMQELTQAIVAVASGQQWIQPAVSSTLKLQAEKRSETNGAKEDIRGKSDPSTAAETALILEPLTDGEQQVLRLIAAGFSNNEIAQAMHKSPGRIRNMVTAILEKLAVRDRTQAALKGLELNLI